MTPITIGGAALGAAGLGAWLRWAVVPAGIAYRLGRMAGRRGC